MRAIRPILSPLPCLLFGAALAAEWPEWRGPGGQGHAGPDAADTPTRWAENSNVVWRTAIPGRGWSTPVIDGRQIWLTTAHETHATEAEARERLKANTGNQPLTLMGEVAWHAVCVDRDSGAILHDVRLFARKAPQWVHELNSYASPSPVIDGGRLYCQFGAYGTACVDMPAARVAWTNLTLEVMHENGPGGSPVVAGDLLIFHLDGSDRQFVAALDKKTGETRWTTPRSGTTHHDPQLKKSYGTPLLVDTPAGPLAVSQGSNWLYGYDPVTGAERWKVEYGLLGFSVSTRPVSVGSMVYYSTGFMRPEFQAVDIAANPPRIVWRNNKGVPQVPSPIAVGDEVYFVNDKAAILTCLDRATGAEIYRERLGGNMSAASVHASGHLYFSNREGETYVVKPGRAFQTVAVNKLDGRLFASPAVAGKSLFLRTDQALYRIENARTE